MLLSIAIMNYNFYMILFTRQLMVRVPDDPAKQITTVGGSTIRRF